MKIQNFKENYRKKIGEEKLEKKPSVFLKILLPTLIILLLFPPLSCLIFRHSAMRYARQTAEQNLQTLTRNVLPLMETTFSENSVQTLSPETVHTFLLKAGSAARRTGGTANLLIFSSDLKLVYPREEEEKLLVKPASDACLEFLRTLPNDNTHRNTTHTEHSSVEDSYTGKQNLLLTDKDGNEILANICPIPVHSRQIRYLVTYCSATQLVSWTTHASLTVLVLSSLFALITLFTLWRTAKNISVSLNVLCQKSDEIGHGIFHSSKPASFSVKELEQLRLAMNEMSDCLLRSDESQKHFFQNVSHDLRTPLMSISGYAQGIEQGIFPDPADASRTILEESQRLTNLVNSLLTLSRLENRGTSERENLTPIALSDFLTDASARMNGLASNKQIALVLHSVDPNLYVLGKEDLLCQVLDNLLSNAIRYAKHVVDLRVNIEKDMIFISVEDDGDGIAPKDMPHLFERCYKGVGGNFGIGLAIAQTATQAMNGTLEASNRQEGGAVFILKLHHA